MAEISGRASRSRLRVSDNVGIGVEFDIVRNYEVNYYTKYSPERLARSICPIVENIGSKRIVLVSDVNVSPIVGKRLLTDLRDCASSIEIITVPAGEAAKDVTQLVAIWTRLKTLGVDRRDLIVGVGGGVICDIVGLAAATYMRGLPYVLVPTSLMAQVDAAIGGKVGADFLGSKNWVGTFYHPVAVVGFADHLETLDDVEFANGLAEITKVALIAGGRLWKDVCSYRFNDLRQNREMSSALVRASATAKLRLLSADPLELSSLDRPLNFGHCLGHAIEAASSFQLRHGQAVSLGMVMAARIGILRKLSTSPTAEILESVLRDFRLPVALPKNLVIASWEKIDDLRRVRNGSLRMVVPIAPGRVTYVDDIEFEEFAEVAHDAEG